jgi:hypothetical protein
MTRCSEGDTTRRGVRTLRRFNGDEGKRMTPADVLSRLWKRAQLDLAGETNCTFGTVMYHAGEGFENAWYNPNRGLPHIWLWRRDRVPNPADQNVPDVVTQPMEDACILAHEYGHFLSERDGSRTPAYEAALDAFHAAQDEGGRALSTNEQALVLDEETRAWDLGRQVLAELGVDEWRAFDERRERALASYRAEFARHGSTVQ